jgi:hypothetical protein
LVVPFPSWEREIVTPVILLYLIHAFRPVGAQNILVELKKKKQNRTK